MQCRGQIKASAESLSHAAIYYARPEVMGVVHIHNKKLWEKYLNLLPTTIEAVAYGTPEMAFEIERILSEPKTHETKLIVMGGHEDGIISFGNTLEEAGWIVFQFSDSLNERKAIIKD